MNAVLWICESDILSIKDLSYHAGFTKSCNLFNFTAVSHFEKVDVFLFHKQHVGKKETPHLHFRGHDGWFVIV